MGKTAVMHNLKCNTCVTNVTDEIKNRGHNIQFQYNFSSDWILYVKKNSVENCDLENTGSPFI